MPQYVNFENINNWEKVCYINNRISPVTNLLRMATMSIGMHSITKENYKEFYFRLMFQQKLSEYDLDKINIEDVKSHIGLNVQQSRSWMKEETRKKFVFRMYKSFIERLENEQE